MGWAKAGCPCDKGNRRKPYMFDLEEVRAWLDEKGRTGLPGRPTTANKSELIKAQLQWTIERALKTRLERQALEATLHDADECRARRLRQIRAVKAAFLDLPRQVGPEVAGKRERDIIDLIDRRVRSILESFENAYSKKEVSETPAATTPAPA